MSSFLNRLYKIVFGSLLIAISMFSGATAGSGVILLSLIALPIMFAGIFDWRPIELAFKKVTDVLASISPREAVVKKVL